MFGRIDIQRIARQLAAALCALTVLISTPAFLAHRHDRHGSCDAATASTHAAKHAGMVACAAHDGPDSHAHDGCSNHRHGGADRERMTAAAPLPTPPAYAESPIGCNSPSSPADTPPCNDGSDDCSICVYLALGVHASNLATPVALLTFDRPIVLLPPVADTHSRSAFICRRSGRGPPA